MIRSHYCFIMLANYRWFAFDEFCYLCFLIVWFLHFFLLPYHFHCRNSNRFDFLNLSSWVFLFLSLTLYYDLDWVLGLFPACPYLPKTPLSTKLRWRELPACKWLTCWRFCAVLFCWPPPPTVPPLTAPPSTPPIYPLFTPMLFLYRLTRSLRTAMKIN